ncbi:MAG TPA: hypothetical protein VD927_03205 [Chryseosolibacter sp.]|nr:hypothetical protein [Chryseosolibacter sp.]
METIMKPPASGRKTEQDYKNIKGWGIDANPDNNPTYPMKDWNGADYDRLDYERASQQPLNVEVLHSNERPGITRVFGTVTPPSGLSGILRRYAFKFSEGNAVHWMTLLMADRVNVVEGIIDDLKHGIVPNIFKERGWAAEWKYNRKGAVKSIAMGVAITSAIVACMIYNNRNKKIIKPT